jgi:hypothetical protein
MIKANKQLWNQSKPDVFWTEIASCDHVLQVYENDDVFLNALEAFVVDGIKARECVLVIASLNHLRSLEYRLLQHGITTDNLRMNGHFLPVDAEQALIAFMQNGWPTESIFNRYISGLISQAQVENKRIRVFSEMASILWARGHREATMELENLLHNFREKEGLCLFCGYPIGHFTNEDSYSLNSICCSHSKVIGGWDKSKTDLFFQSTLKA